MSIRIEKKTFYLETQRTSMQIQIDQYGVANLLWYGARVRDRVDYLQDYHDAGFSGSIYDAGNNRTYSLDTRSLLYPSYGMGDYRIQAFEVVNPDGTRCADLRFKEAEILEGKQNPEGLPSVRGNKDDCSTLKITLEDRHSHVRVHLYYGVFEKENVITQSAEIVNDGDGTVCLENAASVSLDFPEGARKLLHLAGRHNMERMVKESVLEQGIMTISSNRGTSSHQHNPAVIISDLDTTDTKGDAWGVMLMYSGGFAARIEVDQMQQARLVLGINPEEFSWKLKPKERFVTPEAVLSFSDQGLDLLSHSFHQLIQNRVVPQRFMKQPRPVLINSWEAAYFDFDQKKLLALAKAAAPLGIDLFVLDDGWFGTRNNDSQGLGDFDVNEAKLGSLHELIDEIARMGMGFGIWIEPEMVSEDSKLYRKHPEWALKIPGRNPIRGRYQLVLDLSNPEVIEYLYTSISHLLLTYPIQYIKWDMNRSITDWYSPRLEKDSMKELPHRYVLGLYSLLERLTKEFPDVLFEGCSGGGGRFDAGILCYSPQIWCSDNTDPHERCKIQYGTSFFYPPCTMGSHVSASPNHQSGRMTSLEARAVCAMPGTFGYELDPGRLDEREKEQIRDLSNRYKKHQALILHGDYYRLCDPRKEGMSVWEFVSADKKQVLVQGLLFEPTVNQLPKRLRLKHLSPEMTYQVCLKEGNESKILILAGSTLMTAGLLLPRGTGENFPFEMELNAI